MPHQRRVRVLYMSNAPEEGLDPIWRFTFPQA
jgi:hypothetical protein